MTTDGYPVGDLLSRSPSARGVGTVRLCSSATGVAEAGDADGSGQRGQCRVLRLFSI
jgi:hypothetical protein